jgi:hypothetical protein
MQNDYSAWANILARLVGTNFFVLKGDFKLALLFGCRATF